ncbi:MAG: twin-arginine translocation signal domain-containing protein [Anaerolineae bacterium]|nr:twin-arginine translocation signal domain-containing protein [Anaerolineae bacterium]
MNKPQEEATISRRNLLKALAAAGGAVAASTLLPEAWSSPLVQTGVLPAHAQISADAFLEVMATWDIFEGDWAADVDLMVWDPSDGGEQVDWTNTVGPTATHSGDNIAYTPDRNWESVSVPVGDPADGVYQVWVHTHESFDVEVAVDITTHTDSRTFVVTTPAGSMNNVPIAEIAFPGGTITAWAGPVTRQAPTAESK